MMHLIKTKEKQKQTKISPFICKCRLYTTEVYAVNARVTHTAHKNSRKNVEVPAARRFANPTPKPQSQVEVNIDDIISNLAAKSSEQLLSNTHAHVRQQQVGVEQSHVAPTSAPQPLPLEDTHSYQGDGKLPVIVPRGEHTISPNPNHNSTTLSSPRKATQQMSVDVSAVVPLPLISMGVSTKKSTVKSKVLMKAVTGRKEKGYYDMKLLGEDSPSPIKAKAHIDKPKPADNTGLLPY